MQEYHIFSNYRFGSKIYEDGIGKKYHWQNLPDILLGVASPFIAMLFPGTVVWLFQRNMGIWSLMSIILLYALGMIMLEYVRQKCALAVGKNYFIARVWAADPIYKHMLNMDYENFVSKEGKDLHEKAVRCVLSGNEIGIEAFLKSVPSFLKYTIGLIIYAIIVARSSYVILLYLMLSTAIYFGLTIYFEKRRSRGDSELNKLRVKQNRILEETLETNAQADIMLYHGKELMERQFQMISQEEKKEWKRYTRLFFYDGNVDGMVTFARDLLAYFYLITLMQKGMITTAELLVFVGAVAGFGFWMKGSMKEVVNLFVQNQYMNGYRSFLEFGHEKEVSGTVEKKGIPHEIEFRHVSYGYEAGKKVLDDVSFVIRPGEKIALVGENGAGKTTIVKLLLGLLHATEGEILIDGVNIEEIPRGEYYDEYSAVFQESFVLAASIGMNVAGARNYDRSRVDQALCQAGLKEKVDRLTDGIDTELTKNLSEEGIFLSGGETQKLMLARAIYSQAPMLILDEPTAALDPLAESKMYENYSDLCDGKSSLFISHRLASTRFCDCIYLLENGKISEIGTHEELIQKGKHYASMFETQAKYYKSEQEPGIEYGEKGGDLHEAV